MSEALPEPYGFTGTDATTTGPLITDAELATICQLEAIPAARQAFATMVIDLSSDLIRDTAKHPEWVAADVPFKAKLITLLVAKRSFQNPNNIVAEGSIGPLGGDRYADMHAMGLYLTDAERAELLSLRGDGTAATNPNRLWVLTNGGGIPETTTGYVFDSSGSDWAIPYVDLTETDLMNDPSDTVI